MEFLIYFGGNCGRSDNFLYYLLNPRMAAWWEKSRFMIFGFFSMLLFVKWSVESDFPLTFDRQTKLTELWQFFQKKIDKIENNMNGGMLRDSPLYDFWIIFKPTSYKIICRIWFFIYFWPQTKLTELWQFFCKKSDNLP